MMKLFTNKYLIGYFAIYFATLIVMLLEDLFPLDEIIALFAIIGIFFSSIAYFISRSAIPIFTYKPGQRKENYLLIIIVTYFVLFITYYKKLLIFILPGNITEHVQVNEVVTGIMKLIFIVGVPILLYSTIYNFSLRDWGITVKLKACFTGKSLIIFFTFFLILILFQFFVGSGAKPIKDGLYSERQYLFGLPLCYFWLLINVGLVEEFFFRSFLQSRLSVLLKSQIGGIIISALIFGLAHAPGIYLRGSGSIANLGSDPGLLMSIGYSVVVLSVAGFFLSIIWVKTKNLWLIVAIHAVVDLLPNLSRFIELWGIK